MLPTEPSYTTHLAHLYYTEIYPYALIHRFVTCNKGDAVSPQCREMRLEGFALMRNELGQWYYDRTSQGRVHMTLFNRKNDVNLRHILYAKLPLAIHIKNFLPLQLEPKTFQYDTQTGTLPVQHKRKRDYLLYKGMLEKLKQEPPLYESRGRGHIHLLQRCKELVFDIDVPDFDRFCDCAVKQSKTLCTTCWLHIEGCCAIIHFIMTEMLGYNKENLLYVYSGGKGLHCFNNDRRAMALSQGQRDLIFSETRVGKEDDVALCEWIVKNATPALSQQLETLFYDMVLRKRNLLQDETFRRWVCEKLHKPYPATYHGIYNKWTEVSPVPRDPAFSVNLWQVLKMHAQYEHHDANNVMSLVSPPLFIIYRLYFPMIDAGPLSMKHEIKLPFSIHTTTTNIALPIDQESLTASLDKRELRITLSELCSASKRPSLYQRGVALLDKWLDMYSK